MKENDLLVQRIVKKIVDKYGSTGRYVIYPYGKWGKRIKKALNELGVVEYAIIDNHLVDSEIKKIDFLKNIPGDFIIIVATARNDVKKQIVESLTGVEAKIVYSAEKEDLRLAGNELVHDKIMSGALDKYMCYHPKNTNSKFYLPFVAMDAIQRNIFLTDDYYEKDWLFEVFYKILSDDLRNKIQNGIIIDCGANIGNHTLFFMNELKVSRVVCFEPAVETFIILQQNIKINNCEDKVALYNAGCSDKPGFGKMKYYNYDNIGGSCIERSESGFDVFLLDEKCKGENISFIKIDVEGMELNVLKGAKNIIKANKPVIMLETFSQLDEIKAFFKDIGVEYSCVEKWPNYLFY